MFGGDPVPRGKGWVIDRSGTMFDVLPRIKDMIRAELKPGVRYVLVDFNEGLEAIGTNGFVSTVGDEDAIRARLDAMNASGGAAGCLTPIWGATRAAIASLYWGSKLTLFTDASSSDAATHQQKVSEEASRANIQVDSVVTGSCSPLDPSYAVVAQNSNGAMVLVEHTDEGVSIGADVSSAALRAPRGVHSESGVLAGSKTVTFPVESGVEKLLVVTGGAVSEVRLVRPSGATLVAGADATVSAILNGTAYVVTNPAQGIWQVIVVGDGAYSVTAQVDGALDFQLAEFKSVMHVGRAGHEYRPALPIASQTGKVWLKAHIVGAGTAISLELLRLDASSVASFSLASVGNEYYEGEVVFPSEPTRMRVSGFDGNGFAFARIYGQGHVAAVPAPAGKVVAAIGASGTWRAGTVNAFAINLKNLGGDDTVSFAPGTLPSGATLTCNPSSMAIPGSEQVNVLCSIFLPEAPDRADFSVVVLSTTAVPAASQTVTVPLTPLKLPLSCALDIDGDNRIDPAIDGLLLTRYLLGFRGDALTANLTILGPRKTASLLSTFFGNAAQFDVVGRASPAPTATVDGLIMTRLMLGYPDTSLLNGINIPVGAQYTTAAGIKDYVISRCAGGF